MKILEFIEGWYSYISDNKQQHSRDYLDGDIEDGNETVLEDIEDVEAAVFSNIHARTCSFHR